jgi:hypothetical protein
MENEELVFWCEMAVEGYAHHEAERDAAVIAMDFDTARHHREMMDRAKSLLMKHAPELVRIAKQEVAS